MKSSSHPVLTLRQYVELALIWPILGCLVSGAIVLAVWMGGGVEFFSIAPVDTRAVLLEFASWAALTPFIVFAAIAARPGPQPWGRVVAFHCAAAVLIAIAHTAACRGLDVTMHVSAGVGADLALRILAYGGIALTTWSLLLFTALLQSLREERRVAAAAAAADQQLLVSTSPYFSSALADVHDSLHKPQHAEQLTVALASLLREQLNGITAASWTLDDEVRLVDRLVDVESLRGRRARVAIDIPTSTIPATVPPGWIAAALPPLLNPSGDIDIGIVVDSDDEAISGAITTPRESVALRPLPHMRDDVPSSPSLHESFLARAAACRVPMILAATWLVATTALFLRAIDHHYAVTGWSFLVSPVRALTWTAIVAAAVWWLPVRFLGRWKWTIAVSIGSSWFAEWLFMVVLIPILKREISLEALYVATAFALMGLSPASYVMLTMGAGLSVVRIARERAAILERESEMRARLARLEANLLRQQMNPHFLFNALNSLAALIRSSRDAADAFVEKLLRFHGTIARCTTELVDVKTELALTSEYLDIEQTRFGRAIPVIVLCDERSENAQLPPLAIQSLVENAVKHGDTDGQPIRVSVTARERSLIVTVENKLKADGRGERKSGIGLHLLRQRLSALFAEAATLDIREADGMHRAELVLPLTRADASDMTRLDVQAAAEWAAATGSSLPESGYAS